MDTPPGPTDVGLADFEEAPTDPFLPRPWRLDQQWQRLRALVRPPVNMPRESWDWRDRHGARPVMELDVGRRPFGEIELTEADIEVVVAAVPNLPG